MKYNFKRNIFLIRLFHWEYWPFAAVYGPILPMYFWYAFRAKSFFFFSTSNPAIKNAGFEMESKFETDNLIPQQYRPTSIYFEPNTDFNLIKQQIAEQQFIFPLIIKPDIGGKGVGVKKVNTETELIIAVQTYHSTLCTF
jgi:acetyl/propionyl-CoA carboxylase alpha subunit